MSPFEIQYWSEKEQIDQMLLDSVGRRLDRYLRMAETGTPQDDVDTAIVIALCHYAVGLYFGDRAQRLDENLPS